MSSWIAKNYFERTTLLAGRAEKRQDFFHEFLADGVSLEQHPLSGEEEKTRQRPVLGGP